MALGARPQELARQVTSEVFMMLILGSAVGMAAGVASEQMFASLLFEVKATEWLMLAVPLLIIVPSAVLAAVPAVMRAVKIDPAAMLRSGYRRVTRSALAAAAVAVSCLGLRRRCE